MPEKRTAKQLQRSSTCKGGFHTFPDIKFLYNFPSTAAASCYMWSNWKNQTICTKMLQAWTPSMSKEGCVMWQWQARALLSTHYLPQRSHPGQAQLRLNQIKSPAYRQHLRKNRPFFTGVWNHSAPPSLNLPREIPLVIWKEVLCFTTYVIYTVNPINSEWKW